MNIITDPLFYVLAVPAVTALGLGKGGFSGVGMISTPLLALTVPPLQAAAILLPILLVQDIISVWVYRQEWSAWNLKVLLPGAVVGVAAAWLFATYVSQAWVELAVGLTGVCFSLYSYFGKVPAQAYRPTVPIGMVWGALAGFTSTIIQVGAPPYQVHILPQRLDKLTLIGTTIIFFALLNMMKVVPYFALGQFSAQTLGTSLVLLPFAIATNLLGLWLARRTPTELFYRVAYVLMFLISLALIWQGAASLAAAH
ncbi:MAG: sulfite exporter TauE/SafE family protein [Xanthobacteraceae bacterium]